MKYKVTLAGVALLAAGNSWAATVPYYDVEEISVAAEGASYGPYPSAMSDDGTFIGTYSMKASLSQDIDLGLPFTFNRACQYDDEMCELEFYGSEDSSDLSYDNAYQAWRDAQYYAQDGGYSSYMMGNAFSTSDDEDSDADTITITSSDAMLLPFDLGDYDTDVKVTDVFVSDAGDKIVIGYSSAPYDGSTERDFVRRAFIYNQTQNVLNSLLPDFYVNTDDSDADDANGGFSSAYKIKKVTYDDGTSKILVVGASSISLPEDDDDDDVQDYFNYCYGLDDYDDDEISTLNNLVYCSGFDTQAWAWDVTDYLTTTATDGIRGSALATEWLDDNEENVNADGDSTSITYSASALDINASGIAVGVSTFEYSDAATGGRQRAIIMTPDDSGSYGVPTELSEASYTGDEGTSGDDDSIYNTWATAITDTNLVIGNREYSASKSSNMPIEFFIYDIDNDTISFPLEDEKVQSTEQRLNGDSSAKTGANSRAYDINESGFIVGKADDYDQTDPVSGGSPRSQSAFLYDNSTSDSWFINDLICSEDDDGVVTTPLYKIRSARVISDIDEDGVYYVLAEGWKYPSDTDYTNETNGSEVMLKLTRNSDVSSPDDSPNCWDSELLQSLDSDYERSGAAGSWLWLFALPLVFIRRFVSVK